MSDKAPLGGGFGCFTWLGLALLATPAWIVGVSILSVVGGDQELQGNLGVALLVLLQLAALILSLKVNRRLERKWAAEKAEALRKENEELDRKRELERKFYRENPERLVTEYCPVCNMQIPAFAQRCPYCTSNLREE